MTRLVRHRPIGLALFMSLACGCVVGPGRLPDDGFTPGQGCETGGNIYAAGTSTGEINVNGTRRSFRVHVPASYQAKTPAPIVLMLHGGGGSGKQLQDKSSKMDVIADREGFITVYPDGTGLIQTWNAGNCCGAGVRNNVDDVAFIAALVDHLTGALCIDEARVFATGMSNGAILSHRLACELSERIAAIAPVAGTIGVRDCHPTRRVPVMQIHGTADEHVPWNGGVGCGPSSTDFISVPETMEGWRDRNGCRASTSTAFHEGNGHCVEYDGCGAPVMLCSIEGGGHSWPGGAPSSGIVDCPGNGPQSTSFHASEQAWRFFQANPMR